jgi:DNA-binding winged helix-turn-helix (wHTH) protein
MLRFDDFELDFETRLLRRGEEPIHLTPKAFELLALLLDHRPKAIPNAAIRDRLWPATFVSESTLTSLVSELRSALGDDARKPRLLRTVHGFGYAFCGEAEGSGPVRAHQRDQAWRFLVAAGREVRLQEGDNVLGREPDVRLQIDAPSVSRAHALIRLDAFGATVEDLASRNGTFVNGRPVQGRVPLHDGDRIRLGDEEVRFKVVGRADLGETRPAGGRSPSR